MTRILDVYLHTKLIGQLHQKISGELMFLYDKDYVQQDLQSLSVALPLRFKAYRGQAVTAFFSGLLPDENVRQRLANYLGLSEQNAFALLRAVGGDCAGALSLYPQGQVPYSPTNDTETLNDDQLKEIFECIKCRPMLAGNDGYRLSLAGAQDKLAVGFKDNRVQLIKGGAPTTHILKPLIEHIHDSAHNELFCMKLAKRVGIDVPEIHLYFVHKTPYCLIRRYDRHITADGTVLRIHQEDFCQALSVVPELKYEREGGPTISACQAMIARYTLQPAVDQIHFLNRIIFNFLIGNADAHGKNFSLLYKQKKPELAPAYDLLSTAIYPNLSQKMAMKIGGKYMPEKTYLRHFYKMVADTKAAQLSLEKQIKRMIGAINDEAIKLKKELERQNLNSEVFSAIIDIIQKRSQQLQL
ncbi:MULTISPECIES: type II toxin-antitoxin system HipA family toxin [unclassified Bartonella]|uniref:type II toxin-antitoxin system HipA family toxin n=1 Tax=unclassified Bartonella TaxID=2645622 RepID=UPI00235F38A3|nr:MULTISPECIES: type II toxin-antitoxin system HipA family toxin [unclassified Bartonella]